MNRSIHVKNKKDFLKALESCYDFKDISFITVHHANGIAEYAFCVTWEDETTGKKALKKVINKVKRLPMYIFK